MLQRENTVESEKTFFDIKPNEAREWFDFLRNLRVFRGWSLESIFKFFKNIFSNKSLLEDIHNLVHHVTLKKYK
jgi:hypothetical protein